MRLLVLCVDVDNDLGKKAKIRGPVLGRQANLEAATKLALIEPESTDANAIFLALKEAKELEKENNVEVATITGDASLGYRADREIVEQLERLLRDQKPEAVVFISDGAADERVLPIIQSRTRVYATRSLVMRQTRELEKTYFVLLEKLKEPAFARIALGIPGALLLLFALGEILGAGLKFVIAALGLYLIIKGLGIEEALIRTISSYRLTTERLSPLFTLVAIPVALAALWLGASKALTIQATTPNIAKPIAWFIKDALLLLPIAALLIVTGSILDALQMRQRWLLPRHFLQVAAIALISLVFYFASDWIIGATSFAAFFAVLILSSAALALAFALSRELRRTLIARLRLEGKEVFSELGSALGKVASVDRRRGVFIVQTPTGHRIDLSLDRISNAGDRITIRY